jgi:site-specific DNA-methyltransferase (adenine-specific)
MYAAACAELKRSIFGLPLEAAMRSLNMGHKEVAELTGCYGNVNHGGAVSNWLLGYNCPTAEQWEKLRAVMGGGIPASYPAMRAEYDARRGETDEHRTAFENLRRPFNATADAPYTDVWDFPTVGNYKGKHPCEKPLAMMQHIVTVSSREGDAVLDSFAGSFVLGQAALNLNRSYVGIDGSAHWCEQGRRRLSTCGKQGSVTLHSVVEFKRANERQPKTVAPLPLFDREAVNF